MKKVYRTRLGLVGLTSTALVEKGRKNVEMCTGNTNVSLPPDFLTELGLACDALEAANITVDKNGGKQDRMVRDARAMELQDLIRALCGYVQAQCEGNGEKILSTGFEVHKSRTPVGVLEAPGNFRALRGNLRGDVDLRWDARAGRTSYSMQVCVGDPMVESDWKWLASTTKNRYTVTGLETDKQYSFRIRTVSPAGAGKYGDHATSKAA